MAILTGRNGNGQKVIRGNMDDLHNLTDWCESMFVIAYGKEEGMKRAKELRLVDAVSLWDFDSKHRDKGLA
jgi:hypothetical protein